MLVIAVPLSLSLIINKTVTVPKVTSNTSNIVVVQPNIDPCMKSSNRVHLKCNYKTDPFEWIKVDSNTTLLIWSKQLCIHRMDLKKHDWKRISFSSLYLIFLKNIQSFICSLVLKVIACLTRKFPSRGPIDGTGTFYESYNGSVLLDSSGALNFYHKSMLVPVWKHCHDSCCFSNPYLKNSEEQQAVMHRQTERTPVSLT